LFFFVFRLKSSFFEKVFKWQPMKTATIIIMEKKIGLHHGFAGFIHQGWDEVSFRLSPLA
jgi:hypothetical protein